jgi:hypothetical protein
MASLIGELVQQAAILGDEPNNPLVNKEKDTSAGVARRDMSVLGATGKLPEELPNVSAEVSDRATKAVQKDIQYNQDNQVDVTVAAEQLQDQSTKSTELQSISDYFDNSFHAMDNPTLNAAQNRAQIKYQLTVEALQNTLQDKEASTTAGAVANWVDRYIIRQFPIGSFEDMTLKSKNVSDEFARAISGSMSVDEYKVFLDTKIAEYSEQGIFVKDNPQAISELLDISTRFGNTDEAFVNAILGAADIVPVVAGAAKVGRKAVGTAIDIATETGKAINLVRSLDDIAKSPTPSTRAGAINGPDAATSVAENIARRTDEPENLANMGPRMTDPIGDKAPVRPLGTAAMSNQTATEVTNEVFNYMQRQGGQIVDKTRLAEYISDRIVSVGKVLNKGYIDHSVDYDRGILTAVFGDPRTGKSLTKASAMKYAAKAPEARAVPLSSDGKAWAIRFDEPVDLEEYIGSSSLNDLTHVEGVTSNLLSKIFGNSFTGGSHLRDSARSTNLAFRAEGAAVRIKQIQTPIINEIGQMSSKDFEKTGEIVRRLQSKDLASKRNWFTDQEFVDLWKADNKGQKPSPKVLKGYRALVNLSDHNYQVQTQLMLKGLHKANYRRISYKVGGQEQFVSARRIETMPMGETYILDSESGVTYFAKFYDGPGANIFELDEPINGAKYIVDTPTIRPLEPEDAMGYNAGGPRINEEATDFVLLTDAKGRPIKVILSTGSRKTAELAAKQIDTLAKAMRDGKLTDNLVRANHDWNPTISTKAQLQAFMTTEGWDLSDATNLIKSKARDEKMFTGVDGQKFMPDASLDEFHNYSNRRNDRPLIHFGGLATVNDNPIKTILHQTNTLSRRIAFSTYNDEVKISLGKKVQSIVDPTSKSKDWRKYYNNIEGYFKDSSDPLARTILERKRITEFRNGALSEGEKVATRMADGLSDWVYDQSGIKFNIGNPAHRLTSFGFFQTFFGDPFQLALQASQTIPIVAMAGIDDGIKGMIMGRYLKHSLKLSGKELDLFMTRVAKDAGYSKQEMLDIRELFIDMARYEVDPSNMIDGFATPSGAFIRGKGVKTRVAMNSVGKVWDKTNKVGMYFMNKGEEISRTTGYGAAVRKWKADNPGKSILSEEGRAWVSNKEQAYTLNMTNMSRASVQQGLLKVPTQFYSYMLRSMEGVFVGKNLTARERMALAVAIGPFWGLTGIGLSSSTSAAVDAINNYLPEWMTVEPGSLSYATIKEGPVNALFNWAGGEAEGTPEISFASRMSLGEGLMDTLRNYRDQSIYEVVLGASGGKAGGTFASFVGTMAAILNGDSIQMNDKALETLRGFKFIDNFEKMRGLMVNGIYSSKTGKVVDAEFDVYDAIVSGLGFPLEEVQQFYDTNDLIYNTNATYTKYSKEIDKRIDDFWNAVNDGNAEYADEIMMSINLAASNATGLTPELQDKLRQQVFQGFSQKTTFEKIQQLQRLGLTTEAEQLSEVTGR